LDRDEEPKLQFEAAWALTNIASGTSEDTDIIIDCDALPILVRLLQSTDKELVDSAVWTLGNILGDSVKSRDQVLSYGVFPHLLNILKDFKTAKPLHIRTAAWATANIYKRQPRPALPLADMTIPVLMNVTMVSDNETVKEACWALSYISEGQSEFVDALLNHNILPTITTCITKWQKHSEILRPCVRLLGSIAAGTNTQTQSLLIHGILQYFPILLSFNKPIIVREACWALSNITAGTDEQIQAVFESGIIASVLPLTRSPDLSLRKEALWVILNMSEEGSGAEKRKQVTQGTISTRSDPLIDATVIKVLKQFALKPENEESIGRCLDVLIARGML
jgi:hypothetical protein